MPSRLLLVRTWGGLFAPVLLMSGTVSAAPAPVSPVTSQVTAASAHVKPGGAATLSVIVTDKTLHAASAVVDLEVYNAKGIRVAQNFWQGQTLVKGQSKSYHWTWKPKARGAYTVKLGIFGKGWKPLYDWHNNALALTVS